MFVLLFFPLSLSSLYARTKKRPSLRRLAFGRKKRREEKGGRGIQALSHKEHSTQRPQQAGGKEGGRRRRIRHKEEGEEC